MGGCISQTAERTACTKCGMQITNPKVPYKYKIGK